MPTSIHTILIHGAVVSTASILPIGQLSEEALEAQHQDFKDFRRSHSCHISREATTGDIFKRLLISSDPYISGLHGFPTKQSKQLPKEARDMLVQSDFEQSSDEDSSNE